MCGGNDAAGDHPSDHKLDPENHRQHARVPKHNPRKVAADGGDPVIDFVHAVNGSVKLREATTEP